MALLSRFRTPASESRTLYRLILGLGAALIVSGLMALILYLHGHARRGGEARQRLSRTMDVFASQAEEVVENKLRKFETYTKEVSIADLLSLPEDEGRPVPVAILGGVEGKGLGPFQEDRCRLRLESSKGDATVLFDFSGPVRNEERGVDRVAVPLEGNLHKDLGLYAQAALAKGFDALLVGDSRGAVFLNQGVQVRLHNVSAWLDVRDGTRETIHEERYLVFPQRIPLPDPRRWNQKKECREMFALSALGLVREDRLRRESLQLPQEPFFVLVFLFLLLGLLSLPFLKLFAPQPREHFRRRDGLLLLFCASSLVGLVVAVFLFMVSLDALRDGEDRRLELLARNVQDRFREEIRRISWQLNQLERLSGLEPSPLASRTALLESLLGKPESRLGEPSPYLPYPHFERALFADLRRIKLYVPTEGSPPPTADIRSRKYFQFVATRDGNLKGCGEGYETFFPFGAIEPVHSLATARRVTAVARRAKAWCEGQPDFKSKYEIDAVVTPLLSLDNAQVPRGFGFVIVPRKEETEGEAAKDLYHSQSWRAGFESLREETGGDGPLNTLLAVGGGGPIEVEYGGRLHRMLVKPFRGEDSPWRLVVFRDQEPRGSIRLQVALSCLILFASYTVACAVLLGITLQLFPRLRTPFFWPDPDRAGLYARLAVAYFFIAVLFLWLGDSLSPEAMVLAGILLPTGVLAGTAAGASRGLATAQIPPLTSRTGPWMMAAAAGLIVLAAFVLFLKSLAAWALVVAIPLLLVAAFRLPFGQGIGRSSGPAWYRAAVFGLLVVLGGLPVYSFFKASFATEIRFLEKASEFQTVLQERWKHPGVLPASLDEKLAKRLGNDERCYTDYSWLAGWSERGSEQMSPTWFDRRYAELRPRYPFTHDIEDSVFDGRKTAPSPLSPDLASPCRATFPAELPEPLDLGLRGFRKVRPEAWLLFVFSLGGTIWLTSTAIRKLFVANLSKQGPRAEGLRGRQILWIGPRGQWVQDLAAHERVVSRSLASVRAMTQDELRALAVPQEEWTLLISDFGDAWANGEASRARIQVLEKLLGEWQGGLWLVSEVAPQELAQPSETTAPEGASLADRLTESFTIVHDRDDRQKIKSLARKEPEEIWRSLSGEERLAVIRVATSGYLALGEPARGLVAYGVLSADPAPRITSPELERLALRERATEESQAVSTQLPHPAANFRPVLAVSLIALLVFLTFTQEDSFQMLSTALGGIATVLVTLSQIGVWLRSSRSLQ